KSATSWCRSAFTSSAKAAVSTAGFGGAGLAQAAKPPVSRTESATLVSFDVNMDEASLSAERGASSENNVRSSSRVMRPCLALRAGFHLSPFTYGGRDERGRPGNLDAGLRPGRPA